ncbi:cysteine-rich venom protein ophanin-like [Hemicordylus capensis]|uniref:cysteine-rich venom protein ophanin-like n=1 Tax=Hemicordylus capensis TaxID=884348 RepID=UPI00230264C5|nr:cysteine-rich venom protein ophanin-like [Hemicordylus capensis]
MFLLIVLLPLTAFPQQSQGTVRPAVESDVTEKQQKEILDKHNAYRGAVDPTASNMLKMVWSKEAGENAKKWASKCEINSSPIEERIVDGFLRSWTDAVDMWLKPQSNFKYGVGAMDPAEDTDVFTQVIWYNSYKLGCAISYCPQHDRPSFFYVCRYCPAGNILDKASTPYKAGPSCGDCPNNCEDKLCTNPCKYVDTLTGCDKLVRMFEKGKTLLFNGAS